MAPTLRSRKIVDTSGKKVNLEQNLPRNDSLNEFDPDNSSSLPPPGPATQAIIDQLAATETEIEELDDITECDLFDQNKESSLPNPTGLPEKVDPHKNIPIENRKFAWPRNAEYEKEGQKTKTRFGQTMPNLSQNCKILPSTLGKKSGLGREAAKVHAMRLFCRKAELKRF